MAIPKNPGRVLPFWAILLSSGEDIAAITERLSSSGIQAGDVRGPIEFNHTEYYLNEMGEGLSRYWARGTELIDPGELAQLKQQSNAFEIDLTGNNAGRRVNIDPGYIDRFAVIAATCKKLPAAIYLEGGVYGILQSIFEGGVFEPVPWTYSDYASAADIFSDYREYCLDLRNK